MDGIKRPDSAVDRIRQRVEEKAARRAAAREAAERAEDSGPTRAATDPPQAEGREGRLPGVDAESPTEIPKRGWQQILKRAWAENKADNMPIIGGGVAFFGFLAIFPTLIAAISLYGLVASPATVQSQVESLRGAVPQEVLTIISDQLDSVASANSGALSVSLVISILAALWSASGGVNNLVTAVNIAYDEVETRNFIKLRGLSLLLTFGAIVFVLLTVSLVAVAPVVLDALPLGIVGTILAQVVRWVLLLGLMAGALAILYRLAPDRDAPKFRWVTLGSVVTTLAWVVVSVAFSFYVSNFGSYSATYGAVAGVVVLMLWLQLTVFLVLLGAEINAETEHQTAQDTTQGEPVPMGVRRATVADELPEPPTPAKEDKETAKTG
ncbi:YihY/virulence factor BrkB family protein [Klenkia sp. PcliD-1-E]|uniref:YihY/virulence factor BrkB family protein n=1 Tax=Klenkia sp. PcliD-1-E TaxID=2954492 RepID=UPI0020977957|nr:YihY/virulence factor BrkB family protein [Klenkia sp. PcliD-1-E]MCO7222014.1 YihY/virulence factor BrkB family protein [Klenkia sp. PcliD-1-E]